MIDVRFERLAKLGGYERRETVSIVEHLLLSMDGLSAECVRDIPTCSRPNGGSPSSQG
jgi:hypothetical protein